jgi:tetratricopeptide (TPR) repeat protein
MMSAEEIASEIERNVDFLSTNTRDVPQRHRSLRAVFDHSWDLLSEEERRVMMRLSVFRGGFRREAAAYVAGASLLYLSALVNKSLLRHTEGLPGRYDFHELVRQYALAKLQAHAEENTQSHERHADYYASWLGQQERQLESSRLHESLNEIILEIDNLRFAWDWMVAHRQISNLQQSLTSVFVLHDIRNWIRQGADLFERAVQALQTDINIDEQAIVLGELMTCQAHMCWHLGDLQQARHLLQEALQLLGPHRDRAMLAELLLYLSILEHSEGNYPTARRLAEECVALNREQGRGVGTVYALSNLGLICLSQGDYEIAYTSLKESVGVMRLNEHSRGTAIALTRLGAAALPLGYFAEAKQCLDESLEITRRLNDRWGIGNALNYLGLLAFAQGDFKRAEALIRESIALYKEDGDQILQACTLADLGHILNERHAEPEAKTVFQDALEIAIRIQAMPIILYSLVGLTTLHAKEGNIERAFELVSYIERHPSSNQQTRDRAAKLHRELEAQLSPEQIKAAQGHAPSMNLDAIVQGLVTPQGRF